MATIKDVAKYANVSATSVSRFLNTPDVLKADTRKIIQEAVEALNYSPSSIARSLRTKTTKTISFIIPSLSNLLYVDLFTTLHRAAANKGYTVSLLAVDHKPDILHKYLRELPQQGVDGSIIAFLDDDSVIDDIRTVSRQVPVVLMTSTPNRQDFCSVFVDAWEGEVKATEHLIEKGCKRIAFVGGPRNGPNLEKLRGFETAMHRHNLEIDPELCHLGQGQNHFTTGFWAVREFIANGRNFDGIVCSTDDIAIGCVKYLTHSGYKVPEDIKVIGFNGIPLINAYEPSISSLLQPLEAITEEAIDLLHKKIRHPSARPQQITFYTTLVVNKSTDLNAPARFPLASMGLLQNAITKP